MSIERIFLIGAGGHGMVVLDALVLAGKSSNGISIFDESIERTARRLWTQLFSVSAK
jgi:hypothetical protein